ncbi:4Fe-4S binding protein [Geobacter hydrogenophilus]|uniref:4Fe-4S ferredoxin n=2 Tax=Geobacter TaxID=28231 RepID=A0A9W6LB15_9BACT|nr:4Fe-4S binding protein [Geobacter hydrogenophilus]MBT0893626.1 4Fe-4S binding protein [Geobacter hydrogenophilus]GLI37677.1 4Fe-4S ferredoxin [Geobacter hydrogenophilus]
MIRKIVQIDEEKCNGCGLCVPACAEGAIKIVNGKAVLAADNLCDGLGACLGDCPQDAIRIIEREADEFDETAVDEHLKGAGRELAQHAPPPPQPHGHHAGGCPGSRAMVFAPAHPADEQPAGGTIASRLRQWPVQLHLVPTTAPYFQDADLLIAADCVAFAHGDFHREFLEGKALVIGCPKLDDNNAYLQKLTELFRVSSIRSITALRMEVPCCCGIVMAARQALAASGKDIPFREVTIGIQGDVKG